MKIILLYDSPLNIQDVMVSEDLLAVILVNLGCSSLCTQKLILERGGTVLAQLVEFLR